jgi:hypothetical protein
MKTLISHNVADLDIAARLQERLWELSKSKRPEGGPHKYIYYPQCDSGDIEHRAFYDHYSDRMSYPVWCWECKWMVAQIGEEG